MRLARIAAGVAIALLFWLYVAPQYAFVTKRVATAGTSWLFDRGWSVGGDGENANVYRANGSIAATVFMRYLTTNLMTLIILFSLSSRALSWRNAGGALAGVIALIPIHAAAILIVAKSIVSPGSLWGNAAQAYTLFAAHALAFALWWGLRPAESAIPAKKKPRRKSS